MGVVLQVCAYGADYSGNFISSLEELETELLTKGYETIYAFCEKAATKKWCQEISKRTKVYYLPEAKARIMPKTYYIFRQIYKENEISIVHSHFELYDIPATIVAPKNTKIFWHLHDPLNLKGGTRSLLWKIQYGLVGKRAQLIAVSDFYRKMVLNLGFPEKQSCLVLNGIDISRLSRKEKDFDHVLKFLTLGWDFYRKGDDLILNACQRLYAEGFNFQMLLNGNETTWPVLNEYLKGKELPFLKCINPTKDVASLYNSGDIFIQASRKETFSYAVCEAAYSGMPVICSDIYGLEWAHQLPTVCFFENENEENLYSKMKEFLCGKKYNSDAYTRTFEIIEDEYIIKAWSRKIIEIYDIEE